MTNLLDQRCSNHAMREAAAECPSCKRFFCRECVTEHAGRMICVGCFAALARNREKTARTTTARWAVMALGGILIAWLVFYYLGLTLARIPSEFHQLSSITEPRASASGPAAGSFIPQQPSASWRALTVRNRQTPLQPRGVSPGPAVFTQTRQQAGIGVQHDPQH